MRQALVPLLGRSDRRAFFDGRKAYVRENGDPAELLDAHLRGETLLGVHYGGLEFTPDLALDIDGPSHSKPGQAAYDAHAAAHIVTDVIAMGGLMPPLLASSRSGSGLHVRVLMTEQVPTRLAHALMQAVKARTNRPEVNIVYPGLTGDGLVLALPGCALEGPQPIWLGAGGSRFVHPFTFRPYEDKSQAIALREWPRSTPEMVTRAAEKLCAVERPAKQPAPQGAWKRRLPIFRSEIDVLAESCEFVKWCANYPEQMSYEQWFSLATVLKPFAGGEQLFDSISSTDPQRYQRREVKKKLDSIRGGPRHCDNLGWACPNTAVCREIGVQSPAGLPFKLRRSDRGRSA